MQYLTRENQGDGSVFLYFVETQDFASLHYKNRTVPWFFGFLVF